MLENLSSTGKITRHSNTVAAGTSDITPSSGIDMQDGYDGCLFMVEMGTITATAVTSIEVHQSSDDGGNDSYTAIVGTKVVIADDDDDKVFWLDMVRPRERFLKCIVKRGTANAVLEGITAIQYGAHTRPTTHDAATVGGGERHVDAAEGTA